MYLCEKEVGKQVSNGRMKFAMPKGSEKKERRYQISGKLHMAKIVNA